MVERRQYVVLLLEPAQYLAGRRFRMQDLQRRAHFECAACAPGQDADISGSWHGAFTYYFCKEMYACNNKLSRAQVLAKICNDLATAGYSQVPQLEREATKRDLVLPTAPVMSEAFA